MSSFAHHHFFIFPKIITESSNVQVQNTIAKSCNFFLKSTATDFVEISNFEANNVTTTLKSSVLDISLNNGSSYSKNLLLKNCSFNSISSNSVTVRSSGRANISIQDCRFDNLNSNITLVSNPLQMLLGNDSVIISNSFFCNVYSVQLDVITESSQPSIKVGNTCFLGQSGLITGIAPISITDSIFEDNYGLRVVYITAPSMFSLKNVSFNNFDNSMFHVSKVFFNSTSSPRLLVNATSCNFRRHTFQLPTFFLDGVTLFLYDSYVEGRSTCNGNAKLVLEGNSKYPRFEQSCGTCEFDGKVSCDAPNTGLIVALVFTTLIIVGAVAVGVFFLRMKKRANGYEVVN